MEGIVLKPRVTGWVQIAYVTDTRVSEQYMLNTKVQCAGRHQVNPNQEGRWQWRKDNDNEGRKMMMGWYNRYFDKVSGSRDMESKLANDTCWIPKSLGENCEDYEEVLSVPLVFHMDSSGLQWTLSQTLLGKSTGLHWTLVDSSPYLEILWEFSKKEIYRASS